MTAGHVVIPLLGRIDDDDDDDGDIVTSTELVTFDPGSELLCDAGLSVDMDDIFTSTGNLEAGDFYEQFSDLSNFMVSESKKKIQ